MIDRHNVSGNTINCLTRGDGVIIAGSEQGLETINPDTLVSLMRDSIYTENVVAVAAPKWGVVSGTKDGILRRWNIDDTSIRQFGSGNLRAGKSIQRMLVHDNSVLVAAGETLLFLDDTLRIGRKISVDFHINDMCFLSHATLILCGHGKIAHVNLTKGTYSRLMIAPEDKKYSSVAAIDDSIQADGEQTMAKRKIPTREEFEVKENEVVHKPTNATWTAYPGRAEPHLYRPSMLGSVLQNGDDYREHEVVEIALQLLKERLAKR